MRVRDKTQGNIPGSKNSYRIMGLAAGRTYIIGLFPVNEM